MEVEWSGPGLSAANPDFQCDQPTWWLLYLQGLQDPQGGPLLPPDQLSAGLAHWQSRGVLPIVVVNRPPDRRRFACALLPEQLLGFTPLPAVQYGISARFAIPRELFMGDAGEGRFRVDFGDGAGERSLELDQVVDITYPHGGQKVIRVRSGPDRNWAFRMTFSDSLPPPPDETWELTAAHCLPGRPPATGMAWVYYGAGQRGVRNPLIFADGFGAGSTSLPVLWGLMNGGGDPFARRLLNAGKDLIILGYTDKTTYVQENAFVAVSCIRRAWSAASSAELPSRLAVCGASMGGLVTRYALAWMEASGEDHHTDRYLSYDTPHNGSWIPLVIQIMAHYFRTAPGGGSQAQSDLLRSPAAQQLLWGWMGDWRDGPALNANPLRVQFYRELAALGWFPSNLWRFGAVNGSGDGTGNGVVPGEEAFNWSGPLCGARPRTQAEGDRQYLGEMWLGTVDAYWGWDIPAFDGAPGGTRPTFRDTADSCRAVPLTWVGHNRYPDSCFIPSISAAALRFDPLEWPVPLDLPINQPGAWASDLDEFRCSSTNTGHVEVTRELSDWAISKLTAGLPPRPERP